MSISPDLSEPMDDSKGGSAAWGRWQQNKKEEVVLHIAAPDGTRGKHVQESATSLCIPVQLVQNLPYAGA